MIEDIGDLCANLQPHRFRQVNPFQQGEGHSLGGWALDRTVRRISESANVVGRICKGRWIDPLLDGLALIGINALDGISSATRGEQQIVTSAGGVVVGGYGQEWSALEKREAAQYKSADNLVHYGIHAVQEGFPLAERQFV